MAVTSVLDAVDALGDRWIPAKVGDHSFVVQYELSSPAEGDLDRVHVVFANGTPTVLAGSHDAPDVLFKMSALDFVGMANGTYDMNRGLMTGKVKLTGNNKYPGLMLRARSGRRL